MTEGEQKKGPAQARALRLEAELRANLKKRKEQAKQRARSPEAARADRRSSDEGGE